jgi:hypothetical protein
MVRSKTSSYSSPNFTWGGEGSFENQLYLVPLTNGQKWSTISYSTNQTTRGSHHLSPIMCANESFTIKYNNKI